MNPELESILKAYDAATQARGDESKRLKQIYEVHLAAVLERRPHLSRHSLKLAIELAYSRWKKAQERFTSLPPRS